MQRCCSNSKNIQLYREYISSFSTDEGPNVVPDIIAATSASSQAIEAEGVQLFSNKSGDPLGEWQ